MKTVKDFDGAYMDMYARRTDNVSVRGRKRPTQEEEREAEKIYFYLNFGICHALNEGFRRMKLTEEDARILIATVYQEKMKKNIQVCKNFCNTINISDKTIRNVLMKS